MNFSYCHSFITQKFIFKCSVDHHFLLKEVMSICTICIQNKQSDKERGIYSQMPLLRLDAVLEIALICSIDIECINPPEKFLSPLGVEVGSLNFQGKVKEKGDPYLGRGVPFYSVFFDFCCRSYSKTIFTQCLWIR